MNVLNVFDNRFMKAEDLKGKPMVVTITDVDTARFGSDTLPVIIVKEVKKGIVLNFGSARRIAALYGEESDGWKGKFVTIFPTSVIDRDGETVPCIRVRSQAPQVSVPKKR
jgi:hypothetical protein